MDLPAARVRERLLQTFTGQSSGTPEWVLDLEHGDDAGHFGPGSAVWSVHGGMSTIAAGIRALLVQALHPGAMAGVHDFSRYREDPFGRLAGTIRWMFTVSYGSTATARAGSDWVRGLHERVRGTYLDAAGDEVPYAANDPDLARWVHLAFTDSFLRAAELWGEPIPGGPDAYVREWSIAGELIGVDDPPRDRAALNAQLRSYLPVLGADARVAEAVRFIRRPPLAPLLRPAYPVLFHGAVASLPPEFRALLGIRPRPFAIAGTRVALRGVGRVLAETPPAQTAAMQRRRRLGIAG